MNYKTIKSDGIVEEEIKKSLFICHLKRVDSEEEGRNYITQIKKAHYKANHSCSAMVIGEKGDIKRSSDDGEPSGTAGIPMLTVLEKQGLTNVVAVVTRYFGGIKLGTGGLIRAYSGSVANAIKEIEVVEVKEQIGIRIQLTYPQYQTFDNFLKEHHLQEFETEFLEAVTCKIYVDPKEFEHTITNLTEFYQGKALLTEEGSQIVEIPFKDETDK
ncbi:TPA: YigZ family protein [Streptococcus agalactiae]